MKNIFLFIPDTKKDSGLGHYHRCLSYSKFIEKKKIIFLINKEFKSQTIIKNKLSENVFYKDLLVCLNSLKKKYKKNNIYLLVDSYDKNILKINFSKFSRKSFAILDFKLKTKIKNIIDHTFCRKKKYFNYLGKKRKLFLGTRYFPILQKKKEFNKNKYILINFGSVNKPNLIIKSLLFLKKIKIRKKIKILVLNNFKKINIIKKINLDNEIKFMKYKKDIYHVYKNSIFCIGSCGISLYERSYLGVPSIIKSVAKNQETNYYNFLKKKCAISYDTYLKKKNINEKKLLKDISSIKLQLKKNFDFKVNKNKINNLLNK